MEELFITKIDIKNVRHLKDITIPLSTETRKHLILTGKNGSGKTSVLNALNFLLDTGVRSQQFNQLDTKLNSIKSYTHAIEQFSLEIEQNPDKKQSISNRDNAIYSRKQVENSILWFHQIPVEFTNINKIVLSFLHGEFIIASFAAKRKPQFEASNGVNKVNLPNVSGLPEGLNKQLVKYLVYLRADASFLRDEGKAEEAHQIEEWLASFEQLLKKIFNDEGLKLEFDRSTANYTYNILQTGREKADFNTLSDGYSAILSIVSELILRMQQAPKPLRTYEMQGIVLIDEIETHLHLELQKQIFPFLTTVFPKIQFIVTTHSPFVISSVENAVVYDLETRICTDALYGSSYEAIAEAYFDVNKYSSEIQERLKEYETLVKKDSRTPAEAAQMIALEQEFESLPTFRSPELFSTLRKLRNRPAANGQSH
ncbi:MAG: AAA family ATPase [Candidatus Kapabacteria bacterium]|jgi:AAA15 family ATPase/GTPase|nr:AAA family ATPase [Candidatus Kapabacteria bacterium]